MKRLTISMSDELFKKLDEIPNKSLFVRNIIENELKMGGSESVRSERVPSDDELGELREMVLAMNKRLDDMEQMFLAPSTGVQGPASGLSEPQPPESTMPDLEPSEEPLPQSSEIVISDLEPSEEPLPQSSEIAISDPERSEEPLPQSSEIVISDLEPSEEPLPQSSEIAMSDLEPSEESTSRSAEESATTVSPAAEDQDSDSGSDLLEGTIFMYLPHGVELKLDILKSLLSMRYDMDQVGQKVRQMEEAGIISTFAKEGDTYLTRR
ncbi:MAG: hypothetical protein U9N13_07735 [Euryarchaeota archaeon]|nr:hypothetical protein [Euryarchaeota archaeon]